MIKTFVSIPRYQINEQLYEGSRTLVYRGYREADLLPVVIKLLKNPYPSFSELVQFRNQYTIAKNLNSPLIVQTYNLEPYDNGYALVMEDFGGISLKEWLVAGNIPVLQDFLQIAIALCNVLEILYRHQIIHKDIKPSNILINLKTKQVKLIDFSIASLLPREVQTLISPNVLEGTLAYIAPEQTGRMNRGIDYRTDFYSLGVTFYELLTGELPFISNDPMELVHCHIAKTAPLAHEINSEIPSVVSKMISKLMAKNAEDRYQSASGLKFDLDNCLVQLQATGKIENFEIAQSDICDRFLIPEKLYGREAEVQILLEAFERVTHGSAELMIVAGFSGIGKTAVINEVHKPIVRQRGYFIKGKYDQFNHNIPLSAFIQALRDLIGQLLCESDEQLTQWKTQILAAVGENGQVLIEVLPELEQIIGKQPVAPELSGSAAQNRFNLLFQKFIKVLTTPDHPLVIFLDDLQWADLASLQLIKLLMNAHGYLLMLGAYRDNEVSPAHPFILTVEELKKSQVIVNTITLASLTLLDTNHLIADTLNCTSDRALLLTELITRKTKGNPFFITQFLKALYTEGYMTFNCDRRYWECDLAQITALSLTDDVVEFMAQQLQKLPFKTQQVLKLAACVGNQFDLATLAIVSEQSPSQAATLLWNALQAGLIMPTSQVYKFLQSNTPEQFEVKETPNPSYRFLHDRIQQAAYSLIPEDQKQYTHLQIGRLFLQNISHAEQEEKIFDIVNQFNLSIDLITHHTERDQLSQLNLIAGHKSKIANAYIAASEYFNTGINLLALNSWEHQYNLSLSLYEKAAEVACLNSNFLQANQLANIILQHAKTTLDKIKAYEVIIQTQIAQVKLAEAVKLGLHVLSLLDINFPESPSLLDIQQAMQEIASYLQDKNISDLINLSLMTDAKKLAAMKLLSILFFPALTTSKTLFPLIVITQINMSIQYGNAPVSTFAYATYGLILQAFFQDIETSYQFGNLALNLADKLNNIEMKAKTLFMVAVSTKHGKEHIKTTLPLFQEAYDSGIENGDLEYASHAAINYCQYAYFAAQELSYLQQEMSVIASNLVKFQQTTTLHHYAIVQQVILNLLSTSKLPYRLVGEAYDEEKILPVKLAASDGIGLHFLYLHKLILCYLFEEYSEAVQNSKQAEIYLDRVAGCIYAPVLYFYDSLALLSLYTECSESQRDGLIDQVNTNLQKIEIWSNHAPVNYLHKYYLIQAEYSRVLGDKIQAIECYDRAISQAKASEYIQEEALANELTAKFYLNWGKYKVAASYMQEAYYCYAKWGAKSKNEDLEKRYPQLLQPILQQQKLNLNPLETIAFWGASSSTSTSTTGSNSVSDALDFTSILKAAQTISRSIELDELITSLTHIILENSGASKSVLILPQENTWQVRAITEINHQNHSQAQIQTILDSQLLDTCLNLPKTIINYVKNTLETVVINNCQTDIPGIIEEYILTYQPKSMLCTAILNKGNLVGIVYLENQITSDVFTSKRLQVINLLSSQAAISLENARLYQQSQQALQNLQQAQLRIVQSEKMSALGNLVAGIAHEMNNPLGFIAASLQQVKPILRDVINHLKLYQELISPPGDEILNHAAEIDLEYTLEDLPKIIDSMVIACNRLKNISTSLRTFSRADQNYKVPFNIHEGIESTILILKHRLKYNDKRPAIEVITNYSKLPEIECFPGQLNQVFMNILANAIDAIEESIVNNPKLTVNNGELLTKPQILIRTEITKSQQVMISIADNGKGMNEDVKTKIFEHLFTTKGVGQGTGLGLAIAQQIIVEKHGGSILCNSSLDQGTEFVILMPIKH